MMISSRHVLTSILMLTPTLASAGAAPLTAEQTFDLYARTIMEDDQAARRRLVSDVDASLVTLRSMSDNEAFMSKVFPVASPLFPLQHFSSAKNNGSVTDSTDAFIATVLRNTHCRATHSNIWHRISDGYRIADVSFSCNVADVMPLQSLFDAAIFNDEDSNGEAFWPKYLSTLRDGPFREVHGITRLLMAPDDATWRSDRMNGVLPQAQVGEDIGTVLTEAWMAVEDWPYQTVSTVADGMTGIAECDDFVAHYRGCVARISPHEVAGAKELAKELKVRRGDSSEPELIQHCKALRSKVASQWPEACR